VLFRPRHSEQFEGSAGGDSLRAIAGALLLRAPFFTTERTRPFEVFGTMRFTNIPRGKDPASPPFFVFATFDGLRSFQFVSTSGSDALGVGRSGDVATIPNFEVFGGPFSHL
jgi:hypothetical protein